MKQINKYIILLIISLIGLSACTTDEEKVSGKGTISIGVNLDTSVKTKAGENIQGPIRLTIVKSDKDGKPVPESPVYEYDLTTDGNREISLNADTYLLTAIVGTDPKGSPASEPYYIGTKIVTLTAGKTEKITMDCKLTTAVIVVDYSGLGDYGGVSDYQTIVENSAGNIVFGKNSETKGYFVAGKALSVTFRYKIGATWTEKEMPEITTLVAQHQYTIKYTVKDDGSIGNMGSAGIGIEITNPTEEDVQIDITIPLNLSVQIIPDETSAEIIGLVKTNTGLKNATFKYKAKDATEWTSVALDSDLKANVTDLKSGQLYNYKFVCAGNEKTGDFVTSPTINPWAKFALFTTASGNMDDLNGFTLKYKEENAISWIESSDLTLSNLNPDHSYEYMFVSPDGNERVAQKFKTEKYAPLTNGDFEIWSELEGKYWGKVGKTWYVGASSSSVFWDSGNYGTSQGLAILGGPKNPTYPSDGQRTGGSGTKIASLASQYVGLGGAAGKFAAGNIYVGKFGKVKGTKGAEINFGRKWDSRPTALSGWFKYSPGSVDYQGSDGPQINGEMDMCAVFIALVHAEKPVSEDLYYLMDNTNLDTFLDYSSNNKDIIAYGELPIERCSGTSDNWENFNIPLVYRNLDLSATHIIIVVSASKYGDYFTGSTNSKMFIDDLELLYDSEYLKTE